MINGERAIRFSKEEFDRMIAVLDQYDETKTLAFGLRYRWEHNDGHLPINYAVWRATNGWVWVSFTGNGTIPGSVHGGAGAFETEEQAVADAIERGSEIRVNRGPTTQEITPYG